MSTKLGLDSPAVYQIKVQGELGWQWSSYLGGMSAMTSTVSGTAQTTLLGTLNDQAMLLGILNSLYNLGFPLLDVKCVSTEPEARR